MRAHGRGLALLRSFPRSSLETVLVQFNLLRACVPRLPPRAAEPASPSTMLLQARKCMRTRQRAQPLTAATRPRRSKGAAPGARCRGWLPRALPSGAVNRGVASRRSRAGGVGSIPGGTGSARDRDEFEYGNRYRLSRGWSSGERGSTGFGLIYLPQTTSNCSLYSYPRTPRLRWQHTPAHVN